MYEGTACVVLKQSECGEEENQSGCDKNIEGNKDSKWLKENNDHYVGKGEEKGKKER